MQQLQELAQVVRSHREALGLSVREVAKRADISATMLSRIENSGVSAGAQTLLSLASVVDVDPDLLLILACKLPPDIEELLFSGDLQPRLTILKNLRESLKQL